MSFLTRTTRIAATRAPVASRAFTASAVQNKTVVDTAKDTLKAVDRKVSDKLVDGIEIGGMFTVSPLPCSPPVGVAPVGTSGKA
jgi:guanyl-specific ribonuclease Sa